MLMRNVAGRIGEFDSMSKESVKKKQPTIKNFCYKMRTSDEYFTCHQIIPVTNQTLTQSS